MKTPFTSLVAVLSLAALALATVTTAHASATARSERLDALCGSLSAGSPRLAVSGLSGTPRSLRVVAIGSSSTAGAGASSPGLSYVSQLATELKTSWPARSEVFNRGVGGNTLQDIIRRAQTDVYALRPNVVIVQTGTNDALRNVPIAAYKQQLQKFVDDLQRRQIAVILVDNQFLPDQTTSSEYLGILGATHQVAREAHLPLVSRFELSASLQGRFQLAPGDLLSDDGLHPNDLMHGCTARALTATLLHGTWRS